jgi:hypothetical protein
MYRRVICFVLLALSLGGCRKVSMQLKSPAFNEGGLIPRQYTCDGDNVNPPLTMSQVPPNTQSLTLIIDDPDAPAGTWVHWLVWNINPHTTEIPEASVPEGSTQGLNDFGNQKYGGPCPPSGSHRYRFTLYAMDTALNLAPTTTKDQLLKTMAGHIVAQAQLVGTYHRQ